MSWFLKVGEPNLIQTCWLCSLPRSLNNYIFVWVSRKHLPGIAWSILNHQPSWYTTSWIKLMWCLPFNPSRFGMVTRLSMSCTAALATSSAFLRLRDIGYSCWCWGKQTLYPPVNHTFTYVLPTKLAALGVAKPTISHTSKYNVLKVRSVSLFC